MKRARIAICDDELLIRMWLEEHLKEEGYYPSSFADRTSLIEAIEHEPVDLVLLDLRLPDGSGIEAIPKIHEIDSSIPIIMITAYGEVETAVAAVRAGAHHFLEKPIQLSALLLLIEQALESRKLRGELEQYRQGYSWQFADVTVVGRSHGMRRIAELIARLAAKANSTNILIRGESGVGKDVVARAIHAQGPRRTRPFISVNCTALPEHLVESELFGHEAGAFTDAREAKKGLFELANNGTIFLDEIGDMPVAAQAKLLGFLEMHSFRRVGGVRDIDVDVHVIAATNRDLEARVAGGLFREDLFYRLNVLPICVPPLRERPEDVAPLAHHFVSVLAREMRSTPPRISEEAMAALEHYAWPGNARELRNVVERSLLLDDADEIDVRALPPEIQAASQEPEKLFVLPAAGVSLDQLERELICQALERVGGNKSAAARLLGLSRDTLRYRLEKYQMEPATAV